MYISNAYTLSNALQDVYYETHGTEDDQQLSWGQRATMGLSHDLKAGQSLLRPIVFPRPCAVLLSPKVHRTSESGGRAGGERISSLQPFRLITGDGDLM